MGEVRSKSASSARKFQNEILFDIEKNSAPPGAKKMRVGAKSSKISTSGAPGERAGQVEKYGFSDFENVVEFNKRGIYKIDLDIEKDKKYAYKLATAFTCFLLILLMI